jgi:adenylate cyclase
MDSGHFVARQKELGRLDAALKSALAGRGQVVLICGDAGSGKTALAMEFARQAEEQHKDLLVASGVCDPQIGEQAAYTPFREVVGVLAGDQPRLKRSTVPSGQGQRLGKMVGFLGDVIMEFGPDIIGVIIPGSQLFSKIGKFAINQVGVMDKLEKTIGKKGKAGDKISISAPTQDQIFEQYTNVLRALSKKAPLLIILDDLHWADTASIDLLFRISRRLEDARILLLCTYRANEIQQGRGGDRHPLEKVINELLRYNGEIRIDLTQIGDAVGREFINTYLDAEPNRLDAGFRDALFNHTHGHALFTVELLRDLQDRKILVKNPDGCWVIGEAVEWDYLPARVEGIIAERIQSLAADLREHLTVASVEGEQFTVEVVARVQASDVAGLVRRFSMELDKVHQLIQSQGTQRVGLQRISRYQFAHNLFQYHLYQSLDEISRSYLHESIGLVLEELYAERTSEIAAQLARHFDLAGLAEKAAKYYVTAGDLAANAYANDQALIHYDHAIVLTPEKASLERYGLISRRERIYDLLSNRTAQRIDLDELERLGASLPPDPTRQAELLLRKGRYSLDTSDYAAAIQFARTVIDSTEKHAEISAQLRVDSYLLWSRALNLSGDTIESKSILELALQAAEENDLQPEECRALEQLGTWYMARGDVSAGEEKLIQSLSLARQIASVRREWSILNNLGVAASTRQDYLAATEYYTQALEIVRRIGNRMGEMILLSNLGEAQLFSAHYYQAAEYANQALRMAGEIGNRSAWGITLINLAEAYREMGDYERSESFALQALDTLRSTHYRVGEAVTLENLGRIALAREDPQRSLEYAREALVIAREVNSPQNQAASLVLTGEALIQTDQLTEAWKAFNESKKLAADLDVSLPGVIAKAGLAHVACIRGREQDRSIAPTLIEEVHQYLLLGKLETSSGTVCFTDTIPLHLAWMCIQVLDWLADPRGSRLLRITQNTLAMRAERIPDPKLRNMYLRHIPEHIALQAG